MKTTSLFRRYHSLFSLTFVAAVFLFTTGTRAAITVLDYYRMGETPSWPLADLDVAGTNHLSFVNGGATTSDTSAEAHARVDSYASMHFFESGLKAGGVLTTARDNFGMEMWVKPTTNTGGRCLAYNGDTGGSGWGLYQLDGEVAGFYGGIDFVGRGALPVNEWTHVALVRSGGTATLYVNGVASGPTHTVTPHQPAGLFTIGVKPALNGEFFQGFIDEVRVFTFAPGQFSTGDLLRMAPDVALAQPAGSVLTNGGSRDFGAVEIGSPASLTFTVTNSGLSSLTGLDLTISGPNASEFRVMAGPSVPVAPGGSTTFTVRLAPVDSGSKSATLRLTTNDPDESNISITLTGTGGFVEAGLEDQTGVPLLTRRVVAWGSNAQGQLNVPAGLSAVKSISAGDLFSVALKNDGTVVAWGANDSGQLNVPALSNVQAIDAGGSHTVALLDNGTEAAWGSNANGQTITFPFQTDITGVSAGGYHTATLHSNSYVNSWGWDQFGQATVPGGLSGVQAVSAGGMHTAALKNDGTVVAWGRNHVGQTTVPAGLTGVQAIAAGGVHTMALKSDGTVVVWGDNTYGEATVPAGLTGVQAVAAGSTHCMALKNDGTVVAWGDNTVGQRNVPATLINAQAIAAGTMHSMAIAHSIVSWPNQPHGSSVTRAFTIRNSGTLPLTVSGVAATGGDASSFTVNTGGMLASVPGGGSTAFNVTFAPATTGVKTTTLRMVNNDRDEGAYDITLTGSSSNPEISVFNGLTALPENERTDNSGIYDLPGTLVGQFTAASLLIRNAGPDPLTGLAVSLSGADAGLFTIGTPGTATLATNATTSFSITYRPTTPGAHYAMIAIASDDADENPFRINVRGTGLTPEIAIEGPVGGPLVAGLSSMNFGGQTVGLTSQPMTFRIQNSGTYPLTVSNVSLMGTNAADFSLSTSGMLATVPVTNGETAFTVTFSPAAAGLRTATVRVASNDADESPFDFTVQGGGITPEITIEHPAGTELPTGFVTGWGSNSYGRTNPPAGTRGVRAITGAGFHTVVLHTGGTVTAWGLNQSGEANVPAGLIGVKAIAAGEYHTLALKNDGTVVSWGNNQYGQTNVSGLTGIQAIAAASTYSLYLKSDGTVVARGYNNYGQTNVPAGLAGVVAISAGWNHGAALKGDGTVVVWGDNTYGQTNIPAGLAGVQAITAGGFHTVAQKSDGTISAWGMNSYNALNAPAGLTGIVPLAAGYFHNLALKNDGTVVAWGSNLAGETNVPAGLTGAKAVGTGSDNSLAVRDAVVDFGTQSTGLASAPKTFTIRNTGPDPLTTSGISVTGGQASDFTAGTAGTLNLLMGNSETTFTVTFTPGAVGKRTTKLRVLSNDCDESIYDIVLTGTGTALSPLQAWRQQHFGSPDNSGNGADLFDFDHDGLTNLVEFAFGLNPAQPNNTLSSPGQLPEAQFGGGTYSCTFTTPPGVAGITYRAEWSATLESNDWHSIPDTGSGTSHVFTIPAAGRDRLYVRLTVTSF